MGDKLLFLSHAGVDSAAALALADRIERGGLKVWIDKRDLAAGRGWQQQLEDVIARHSTAFAVYVGSRGVVNWVDSEVRLALSRATGNADYPFIPVLAKGVEPAVLPAFARQFQGVSDVEGDADALQKLVRAALGETGGGPLALETQPFLGLSAFDESHTHLFFGREIETEELIERLRKTNLLMVVGDSGSGKSSLVKAGLIPRFRGGAFAAAGGERPDEIPWHVVQMRPLGAPFEKLTDAVSEAARAVGIDVETRLALGKAIRTRDADTIRDALREGAPPKAQTLFVVDQFEELWTLTDEPARIAFLDALLSLARSGDGTYRVVLTMRRDYYNLCTQHPALFARLEDSQVPAKYSVRRMSDEALRRCIAQPLLLAGVADAATFADAVLKDVGDQPGELALLEMALTEAWRRRAEFGGDLLKAYVSIGRVSGALANAAEDVFRDRLNDDERRRAEAIFMRFVRLGDTGGTTRRIAAKAEFREDGWTLAQRLAQEDHKRLLFVGADTAEIAHEALVTQWPRYQSWLQQAAADKRKLDALMDDAQRWAAAEANKTEFLARGYELENGLGLLNDEARKLWLSENEIAFVETSESERKREEQERKDARKERERQLRELAEASQTLADEQKARAEFAETSRRNIRRWLRAAVVAAVAAFIGFGGAVWFSFVAQWREEQANEARQIAHARLLAAQARQLSLQQGNAQLVERSAALAAEAVHRTAALFGLWSPDADAAARELYRRLPIARIMVSPAADAGPSMLVWSPEGDRLAMLDVNGVVKLLAPDGQREPVALEHSKPFLWVTWSPSSGRLATLDEDGVVLLWAGEGDPVSLEQTARMTSVYWDPKRDRLATLDENGMVTLWGLNGHREDKQIVHGTPVVFLAWSPEGDRLATAGEDGIVKIWPTDLWDNPVDISPELPVTWMAWNATGKLLATSDKDDEYQIWNIEQPGEVLNLGELSSRPQWHPSGNQLAMLYPAMNLGNLSYVVHVFVPFTSESKQITGDDVSITRVDWDPRGDRIGTVDGRGTVALWPVDGQYEPMLVEHGSSVYALAWSSDGRLATAGEDGVVKIWPTDRTDEPVVLRHDRFHLYSMAWNSTGDQLAIITEYSNGVAVWPADGRGEPVQLGSDTEELDLVAWSPKGDRLARVVTWTGVVVLSAPDDKGESVRLDHAGPVVWIAWSPDGERLATLDRDGVVNLWAPDGRGEPVPLKHSNHVVWASWNPTGDRLAVVDQSGTVMIWDTDETNRSITIDDGASVSAVAWSPDGRLLAMLGNGFIRLLPADGQGEPTSIEHGAAVSSFDWSPKGNILATGGEDGFVKLWATPVEREPVVIKQGTPVQRIAWNPKGDRLAVGGEDGVVRIWATDGALLVAQLCSRIGRNLSKQEWENYIGPDEPWRPTCKNWDIPQDAIDAGLWPANEVKTPAGP